MIKTIIKVIGAFIALILLLSSFTTVPTGYVGIVTQFGAVTGTTFSEGLHLKAPFVQKVEKMSVQVEKVERKANSASRDLQSVSTSIALNYRIDKLTAGILYQDVRRTYVDRLILPSIEESVKANTAKFTAEELITKRSEVREAIKVSLKEKLEPRGLIIEDVSIVNFSFSDSFDKAIEAKVTAEQDALAAQNKLEQVKFEAEQKVEEARGKASAIRIEASAIATNPRIIELRALEKWDGKLPTVTGGAVPFITVE